MKKTHYRAIVFGLCLLISCTGLAQEGMNDAESPYKKQEVTFNNGTITLAGSLFLPKETRHPAGVVLIHGSGSSDRSNPWTTAYAKALAERGVAVLYPDKRGSGKSEGDWRTSGFAELADDAIAGVNFLRQQIDSDSSYIGVIGFSQGGHVAPLTAVRSDDVNFAISVSSSTVPIMEQIMDEVELMAEREGLTEKQIAEINLLHARGLNYALTGTGWEAYKAALAELGNGALADSPVLKGFPPVPDHWAWNWLREVGNFDPLPYWGTLDIPLLFLYGGQDTQIRVQKSIDLIEEKLDHLNATVLLFSQNGHAHYRQDALDFITRWIQDRGSN